jgi:3-phosphoglycerate kinase
MGAFELEPYSKGTVATATGDGRQERGILTTIGGGDSARTAELSGDFERMSYV